MKSKHTDWNINISFIIDVDFNHAWAEHYPITLKNCGQGCERASMKSSWCDKEESIKGVDYVNSI